MKRKLAAVVAVMLLLSFTISISAGAVSVTDFTDVKPTDWYYDAVNHATSIGLFAGTSKTTFSPNTTMSRGMFITVLGRLAGVPDSYGRTKTTPFNDVTQADYFFPYVAWANDNGFDTGVGGGRFAPNAEIPREHMAVVFYRYAEKNGYDLTYTTERYNTFADAESVSGYAVTALQWATTHGVINGDGGNIRPLDKATRAQVAQIFLNFSRLEKAPMPDEPGGADWENYNPTYDIPTGKSAPDADGGYYDYDLAAEITRQVDALRVANGANALLYNPKIQGWAAIRAQEQTLREGHTRPDGTACLTVGQGLSAENLLLANDYTDSWKADIQGYAKDVIITWYNSESHRLSMLNPVAKLGAISCYVKGNNVYIAHLFSMRSLYYIDYLIQ